MFMNKLSKKLPGTCTNMSIYDYISVHKYQYFSLSTYLYIIYLYLSAYIQVDLFHWKIKRGHSFLPMTHTFLKNYALTFDTLLSVVLLILTKFMTFFCNVHSCQNLLYPTIHKDFYKAYIENVLMDLKFK